MLPTQEGEQGGRGGSRHDQAMVACLSASADKLIARPIGTSAPIAGGSGEQARMSRYEAMMRNMTGR